MSIIINIQITIKIFLISTAVFMFYSFIRYLIENRPYNVTSFHVRCFNYLKKQGYNPETVKESGNIIFKKDGLNYLLVKNIDNENILSLFLPKLSHVNDENRAFVLELANVNNQRICVVKTLVDEESVYIRYDRLLTKKDDVEDILPDAIEVLAIARKTLYSIAEGLKEDGNSSK